MPSRRKKLRERVLQLYHCSPSHSKEIVIVGMTMSLDGFIHDRHGSVGALYPDFNTLSRTEPMREAIQNTGAVMMGRTHLR